jgi:diguanylate cyclase (GGDEF)-like protein/PAS domain S-box-containing protein
MKRSAPHFFVVGLLLAALLAGAHQAIRNFLTDSRFALSSRQASGNVILVAIDSPSLEAVGVWPWPRRIHAEALTRLHQAGASEIAFDVDFSSASEAESDNLFAAALRNAGGSVVLPAFEQWSAGRNGDRQVHHNFPLPSFGEHSWRALVNVFVDPDGLVRRYPFGERVRGEFIPSLGALLGGAQELRNTSFLIDHSIDPASVPVVSYKDILQDDLAALRKIVADNRVIVGATALELGDRVNVPNGRILSGAMLQVLATESILQGRSLKAASPLAALLPALALIAVMIAAWTRGTYYSRAGLLLVAASLAELAALWVQARWPLVLDTSLFHLAVAGYLVAGAMHEIDLRGWLGRIAERRFQRVAMSVGDGLACLDGDGAITFWNPGAVSMFGYDAREMIGASLSQVVPDANIPGRGISLGAVGARTIGGELVELEARRKDGQVFPVEAQFFGWEGAAGPEYGVLLRDISIRKRETQRIQYLAQVDTLTGLANRHTLREHLDASLMEAEAEQGEVAVLVLDLDKFKDINDTLGHTCGDELLTAVASRLRGLIDSNYLVARLGGDEFAVIFTGKQVAGPAGILAEQIAQTFKREAFPVHGRQLQGRCSIGIAIYPRDTASPEQLLANADLALYKAKAQGGGKWCFFTQEIKDALASKISLQGELDRAIKQGEFELFYQPQVSLKDHQLVGAEALIRWRHPERGLLMPGEFMDAVHTSALSNEIAFWVLETACRQGSEWVRLGRKIRVGVNLSPSQLQSDDLTAAVTQILRATGMPARLLELEVTENILLHDDERPAHVFSALRGLGVGLSFDDFGTGYGSLSYLKKFPFDRLKIDRSFVQELKTGSDDAVIVSSTIALSKLLGLSVVAEGVEDAMTASILADMGCNEGQGYFFGRPMPVRDFERQWFSQEPVRAVTADAA